MYVLTFHLCLYIAIKTEEFGESNESIRAPQPYYPAAQD